MLKKWEDLPERMKNEEAFFYYQLLKKKKWQLTLKRILDIVFGVIAFIIFILPMAIIACAIKITSKGPIFFMQDRVTQYGKVFKIYKFRTMVTGAEKIGAQITSENDSRVTKIGNTLRKYRLDEIPQIINVLKGEMSFVGARPEVVKYTEKYTTEMLATLLLPAGITSKASINFKDEEQMLKASENIDDTYINEILPVKMKYNLEYIEKYSLLNDIRLSIETIIAIFLRRQKQDKESKKYQIGLCGHFAEGHICLDGQTIRTKILYEEMAKLLDEGTIIYLDTYKWHRHIGRLLTGSFNMARNTEHIIIGCGNRGRKVFLSLFCIYANLFKCKIHEVVIGGDYVKQVNQDRFERYLSQKVDGIYVETDKMRLDLIKLGFKNVYWLANFINVEKVKLNENIIGAEQQPIRLCTFSRVCKEKGTEDIIAAVENINTKYNKTLFELDIYGRIEKEYEKKFNAIMKEVPPYIQYKGTVEFSKCVEILKQYFMLIFPTYLPGEGLPGTVINSFFAGVPVLASDWAHNTEFIQDGVTGVIYKTHDINELTLKLEEISKDPYRIIKMKQACLKESDKYCADIVVKQFLKQIYIG